MSFEKIYTQVRRAEKRIYNDEEVRNLPSIPRGHIHSTEWGARKKSCERFVSYLEKKQSPLSILEVGCGNGWFSAQLAENPSWKITGIDINTEELIQAKRVFDGISNLEFIEGDIRSKVLNEKKFDVIAFVSSIQYFPSLTDIVKTALSFLKPGGEIHIIDTAFYPASGIGMARQRSREYYKSIGFPEAASWYYHHSFEDLETFPSKILYNPDSWTNKFNKNKNPFYWVRIKKPH